MTKIRVDITDLGDLAKRLRGLQHEFESLDGLVHGYHDALGDHRVADRLGDFATNWDDQRKKILEKLGRVAEYAEAGAAAYAELERQLSDAVNRSGPGHG